GKDFKKIEIEILKYRGTGSDKKQIPGKSASRIIILNGTNSYTVIDKSKDDEYDTTTYNYDNCGKLILKKGRGVHFKYSNRYKNCKLMSKEANETEVESGTFSHLWNLISYEYDKAGLLKKELIYDFNDTNILKLSNEYKYKGNFMDSVKEYYYDEDGNKLLNRMTKYFYSTKLDSIHYYSSEFLLIDKKNYTYHPSGKVKTITLGGTETYTYFYKNNELEMVSEMGGTKEYLVRYFE
ncbi:MAG: hypothetical protein ACKVQB_08385, partial [Bacteroidia bacterium]